MNARILITGSGLIGTHVARVLKEKSDYLVLYDLNPDQDYIRQVVGDVAIEQGNICDMRALSQLMKKSRINIVIHTAGVMGHSFIKDPYNAYRINVNGALALAETIRHFEVKKLIYCSSLAVYGKFGEQPIAETSVPHPLSVYGASKVASESIFHSLSAMTPVELVILRLTGIYGYGKYSGGAWMGRMFDELLRRALKGEQEIDWGALGTNEYLYVKDVARAVVLALETEGIAGEVFNIGTGHQLTSREVAEVVRRVTQYSGGLPPEEKKRPGLLKTLKAREKLSFVPSYSLSEGILDYVSYLGLPSLG